MHTFTYLPKDNRNFEKGRSYIGASDLPTLTGLNKKYGQTPLTFWQEFTGRKEGFKGNNRTYWGHVQEPNILAEYVRHHTGLVPQRWLISRLRGDNEFSGLHNFTEAHHPDYPYAVAHADMLNTILHASREGEIFNAEGGYLIQAKNSGFFAAKRGEDKNRGYDKEDQSQNGVPLSVYLQEQWELFCYGAEVAYVAVLIDGADWNLYGPITPHKKTTENCLALAERMWWHIQKDKPPKPETWPDVVSLFPELKEGTATIIEGQDREDVITMRDQLKKINGQIAVLKSKAEDIQNATGLLIGGAEVLRDAEGNEYAKAWESSGQLRANVKELQKKHPRTYGNLLKEGIITQDAGYRALSIAGTSVSSGKCKQCGRATENPIVKREGRKIVYGPFCLACWQRIIDNKGE